jgi:hypothetical protein
VSHVDLVVETVNVIIMMVLLLGLELRGSGVGGIVRLMLRVLRGLIRFDGRLVVVYNSFALLCGKVRGVTLGIFVALYDAVWTWLWSTCLFDVIIMNVMEKCNLLVPNSCQ